MYTILGVNINKVQHPHSFTHPDSAHTARVLTQQEYSPGTHVQHVQSTFSYAAWLHHCAPHTHAMMWNTCTHQTAGLQALSPPHLSQCCGCNVVAEHAGARGANGDQELSTSIAASWPSPGAWTDSWLPWQGREPDCWTGNAAVCHCRPIRFCWIETKMKKKRALMLELKDSFMPLHGKEKNVLRQIRELFCVKELDVSSGPRSEPKQSTIRFSWVWVETPNL